MHTAPPVSPQAPQGNAASTSQRFSLQADPEPNAPRFADLLQRGQAAHGAPAPSSQAGPKPQERIAKGDAQEADGSLLPVDGESPEAQAILGAASRATPKAQLRRKGSDDAGPTSPTDASTEFLLGAQPDLEAAARPADPGATADAQCNAPPGATLMVDPGSLLASLLPAPAARAEAPAELPGDTRSAASGVGRSLRALRPDAAAAGAMAPPRALRPDAAAAGAMAPPRALRPDAAAAGAAAPPNTGAGRDVEPSIADGGEAVAAALAGTAPPERKVDPRVTPPGARVASKDDLPSAADHLPAAAEGVALGRPTPPRPDASASDGLPGTRSATAEPAVRSNASSDRTALVVHLAATSAAPVAVERAAARVEATPAADAAPAALAGAAAAAPSRALDTGSLAPIVLSTPLQSPDFAQALGARVSVLARNGIETAELHLNPAEMGPVRVQIEIDGAKARVDFSADSSTTRQVIERGLPELAAALREQGLTLSGGGVFQHAPDRRDANAGDPNGGQGQSRRRTFTATVEAAPRRIATPVAQGTIDLYA